LPQPKIKKKSWSNLTFSPEYYSDPQEAKILVVAKKKKKKRRAFTDIDNYRIPYKRA
jgi:hypothetical protein